MLDYRNLHLSVITLPGRPSELHFLCHLGRAGALRGEPGNSVLRKELAGMSPRVGWSSLTYLFLLCNANKDESQLQLQTGASTLGTTPVRSRHKPEH